VSFPSTHSAAPRWTLARLVAVGVLLCAFALFASAASAQAATLSVVFDDTSPGASTGSAPFDAAAGPGNDTSPTDHVVRSHDTITYHWGISANGGSSPNTTIRQTLPVGMAWSNLPSYCRTTAGSNPVSSISADGRTIVCNVGTQGSSALDYYPQAVLKGGLRNGDTLTTSIEVSSSDPGTAPVTSPSVTDTVSAAPRVNLEKKPFFAQNETRNGVDGVRISYSLSFLVDSAGGKGMRGAETIGQPVTFTDDISGYLPDAEFIGFENVSGGNGVPYSTSPANQTNAVRDSGDWTGTQAGGPGSNVAITVSGADLSGDHLPTVAASGSALPADKQFLASKVISFFVPFSSLPDNQATPYTNVVSGFDPNSTSGQSNYGAGQEPLADNVVSGSYLKPVGTGGIGKAYGSRDTQNGWLTGATGSQSADGIVLPGQTFFASHTWEAATATPRTYRQPILCDNLDTSSARISTQNLPAQAGGNPAWITGTDASRWVIEYTDGGTRGATPTEWYAATGGRDQTCDTADAGPGGWVSDPATLPGGLDSVTIVRMRAITDATGIQYNRPTLYVNYELRTTDKYTGEKLLPGRKVANFIQFGEDGDNDGTRTWRANDYDPRVNNSVLGAVANVAGGTVRIEKDTDPGGQVSATSGDVVGYKLQPTATAPIPVGTTDPFVMRDVKVVDTIPSHMTYVAGSASRTPDSVVVNGDGTTTITWNLGDVPVNTALPAITYDARVKLTAPNGAQEVNTVVISSADDASSAASRTDTYTVRVDKVFGIAVIKSIATPWTEPLDGLEFNLEYVNNAAASVTSLDMIDVLPHNGDERGDTDSRFHGTARLQSVTPDNAADVVYYSSRAAGEISNNPKNASNDLSTGSTKWCTEAQLGTTGCPATIADATAVRVRRTGNIPSGEGGAVKIVVATAGNESGDVYVNDAGLAAGGVSLPAFAEPVVGRVVASDLGDFVWDDTNKNGIQDPGEPGIAGVKVTLTGTDKDGNAVERSVTTDRDGYYTFASPDGGFTLRSGSYRLMFTKDGYSLTTQNAGGDDEKDSDADPADGRTGAITLRSPIPGQAEFDELIWDAGMIQNPTPPTTPDTPPPSTTTTTPTPTPTPTPKPTPPPTVKKHHALSIAKLANRKSVRPGQRITYTLKVTASKKGNEDAVNERLCDTLPANLTLVTKAGGTVKNGRLCWTIKRLAPGKSIIKRFVVRVDRDAETGKMVNTATVTDQGKKRTAKRTVRVKPAPAIKADNDYVTG
jgi:uncharacterized repeat protein (TIGR01451 family)